MNNVVHLKDDKFWSLLRRIKIDDAWRSSIYSECKLAYYRQRPLDENKKISDASFVLNWEQEPAAIFFGAVVELNKMSELVFYEAPCILIEKKFGLTTRAKKKFLCEFDKILDQANGNVWYRDYFINGNASFLTNYLLKKGAVAPPVFSKVIDLCLDEASLWKGIRKSYSSLVNNGLKEMSPKILTNDNITQQHMEKFRELHRCVSGRETRSIESWQRQFESIQNNEAFVVFGDLDGDLVTAGYFSYSEMNCIYGSSASRRDMFHKPLFHSIMWTAILHAKKIGCKWFEVGEQNFKNHPSDNPPTKKNINISGFKAGFGGNSKFYLDIKIGADNINHTNRVDTLVINN